MLSALPDLEDISYIIENYASPAIRDALEEIGEDLTDEMKEGFMEYLGENVDNIKTAMSAYVALPGHNQEIAGMNLGELIEWDLIPGFEDADFVQYDQALWSMIEGLGNAI
jgi:hypothetical protein